MEAGPVKDALAGAAASFVAADPGLARRVHRSQLVASPERGSMIGLNEAAVLLGVRSTAVHKLMAWGTLPPVAAQGRGVPMLIERAAVEAAAAVRSLNLQETAAALGISKSRVHRLVEGGILVSMPHVNVLGPKGWAFGADAVESLLDEVSRVNPGTAVAGRMVGFEHAAEALRRRGVDLAGAIGLVKSGRLAVAGIQADAVGLKRLRFLAGQVRDMCRDLQCEAPLTIQAAAERMGLKWAVVANLVSRGLLASEDASQDGWVAPAIADRFMAEHVTGGELARRRGTSPRALAMRLEQAGVVPIVGPGVDGSRLNIYRKDAELSAVLATLV